MCGLAGWAGDVRLDERALGRMCDAIAHRGPDDEGFLVRPGDVGLGFRRLSIIDLETGSQPLASEDGFVSVCYGGEAAASLGSGLLDRRPDLPAIAEYLTLQYVPAPGSGFQGISKLAPGELLVFEDGEVAIERYWQLEFPERQASHNDEDCLDA